MSFLHECLTSVSWSLVNSHFNFIELFSVLSCPLLSCLFLAMTIKQSIFHQRLKLKPCHPLKKKIYVILTYDPRTYTMDDFVIETVVWFRLVIHNMWFKSHKCFAWFLGLTVIPCQCVQVCFSSFAMSHCSCSKSCCYYTLLLPTKTQTCAINLALTYTYTYIHKTKPKHSHAACIYFQLGDQGKIRKSWTFGVCTKGSASASPDGRALNRRSESWLDHFNFNSTWKLECLRAWSLLLRGFMGNAKNLS